jgi:hypothetical protein
MAEYTFTVSGVDEAKLRQAVDIAVDAVKGALEQAGLGDIDVDVSTEEPETGAGS